LTKLCVIVFAQDHYTDYGRGNTVFSVPLIRELQYRTPIVYCSDLSKKGMSNSKLHIQHCSPSPWWQLQVCFRNGIISTNRVYDAVIGTRTCNRLCTRTRDQALSKGMSNNFAFAKPPLLFSQPFSYQFHAFSTLPCIFVPLVASAFTVESEGESREIPASLI
jgi:hypothetical protein